VKILTSMRNALQDPHIFGSILPGASWDVWRVILIAAMGEELMPEERVIFKAVTGREREPVERVDELWMICGRRSGKTRAIAILAAYIAALIDFTDVLAPGERASLPIMSASMWQAQKAMSYLIGIFTEVPALARLVTGQTADTISLSTRVDLECRPASFRTIRGGTFVALIGDEVAFWRSEEYSANADREILNAARPSLATTGGMMGCITSPHARSGEAFETHANYYGDKGDNDAGILVGQGPSKFFNPTLPDKVITRAYARDPAKAAAEWGGEFRSDVAAFVSPEVIDSAVVRGHYEALPLNEIDYQAFVDAAGGSGSDSFTVCIAHRGENDVGVVDCIREYRPPFSPASVVKEISTLLETYRIDRVVGDRYAGSWPAERFSECGIGYEPSERTKSQIYVDALPLFNSGKVELLDHRKCVVQLCSLERRVGRGTGRDIVDHPVGGHDDVCNAVCGALVLVANAGDSGNVWLRL